MTASVAQVFEIPELRGRKQVFRDRDHAGSVLAGMLEFNRDTNALVLGIPAGGIPVAAAVAKQLALPLEVLVVSKITLPWNSEAGYGAVAFDETVRLNENLLSHIGLSEQQLHYGIKVTREKVAQRVRRFQQGRPLEAVVNRPLIVVDDGLASGFTMQVAIEALKHSGAKNIVIAVPTGHQEAIYRLAAQVEAVYCANIRGGWGFAVADAYTRWTDVGENEVVAILQGSRHS